MRREIYPPHANAQREMGTELLARRENQMFTALISTFISVPLFLSMTTILKG
jgi:hypothetical protein